MRLTDADEDSTISASYESVNEAGPSSSVAITNGRNGVSKTNGFAGPYTNGTSKARLHDGVDSLGPEKSRSVISRVSLPGSTLYDDSHVDREEFIRLVIQSLRDVGYIESAATLEAESGYIMETPEVSEFRQCILDGAWASAEAALMRLGVSEEGIWEAKFLISQQKYLELLEARKTGAALNILRQELAPLNVETEHLHFLSSLLMCSDAEDLRSRAEWDGVSGTSRRRLLVNLQRLSSLTLKAAQILTPKIGHIPSSVMIPQRRFSTLLDQAFLYQQNRCLYHNSSANARTFSLYTDHMCDKSVFPTVTTASLEIHSDEVWNLEWSHSGNFLATASKDKSAIIWRIGSDRDPNTREYSPQHILREHAYHVGCVAWSPNDSILLTASESTIKMWNARTGVCMHVLDGHEEVVTGLAWLPDGIGFISAGLDRKIILWDVDGKQRETWGRAPMRVTDIAITPDFTRLVAVGMSDTPPTPATVNPTPPDAVTPPVGTTTAANAKKPENRFIVYDLNTKQVEQSIALDGESTSVKISHDSRFALINSASEAGSEIQLRDLNTGRLTRRYIGQKQNLHVIRSCFGGVDGAFVASGSEDGNVYIWHRDSGELLEVLSGHGNGSVNAVAWNPHNERMFASCSDDGTIRIWEPSPTGQMGESVEVGEYGEVAVDVKGKGKGRERWNGDGVDVGTGGPSASL